MAKGFLSFAFINQGQQTCRSMVCETSFNSSTASHLGGMPQGNKEYSKEKCSYAYDINVNTLKK